MTPEQILAIPPRVLTRAQREAYFADGYILLMGRKDPQGAIANWEKLIKDNPNFDQIDRVRQSHLDGGEFRFGSAV